MNQLEEDTPKLKIFWNTQQWGEFEFISYLNGNQSFQDFFSDMIELVKKERLEKRIVFLTYLLINHLKEKDTNNNMDEINWVKQQFDFLKKSNRHQFSLKQDAKTFLSSREPYYLTALIFMGVLLYLTSPTTSISSQNELDKSSKDHLELISQGENFDRDFQHQFQQYTQKKQEIQDLLQKLESKKLLSSHQSYIEIENNLNTNLALCVKTLQEIKDAMATNTEKLQILKARDPRDFAPQLNTGISQFNNSYLGLFICVIFLAEGVYQFTSRSPYLSGEKYYTFWNAITQPTDPEVKIMFDYLDAQIKIKESQAMSMLVNTNNTKTADTNKSLGY